MKSNNSGVIGLLGVVVILMFVLTTLNGCSTVAGMGKDITGAAEWTHDKMTQPEDQPKHASK